MLYSRAKVVTDLSEGNGKSRVGEYAKFMQAGSPSVSDTYSRVEERIPVDVGTCKKLILKETTSWVPGYASYKLTILHKLVAVYKWKGRY